MYLGGVRSVKAAEVPTSNLSKLSGGTQEMIAFLGCIMAYTYLLTYLPTYSIEKNPS
jgi:hypothetical protein